MTNSRKEMIFLVLILKAGTIPKYRIKKGLPKQPLKLALFIYYQVVMYLSLAFSFSTGYPWDNAPPGYPECRLPSSPLF